MDTKNDEKTGGGWYNSRKQYRSVAFGTWQPGAAAQVFKKSSSNLNSLVDDENRLVEHSHFTSHRSGYTTIATETKREFRDEHSGARFLSAKAKKMGESSPNLTRIDKNSYQLFPALRSAETSYSTDAMHRLLHSARPPAKDCYSSTEYVAYLGRKHSAERLFEVQPSQQPSGGWQSARRETSARSRVLPVVVPRVHRSQSAGADATHRVQAEMRSAFTRADVGANAQPGNAKFLRATKKFFKKIYTNATLPKKQSTSTAPSQEALPQHMPNFFEYSYREPPRFGTDECDGSACDDSYLSSNSTYCSNYRSPLDNYRNELNLSTSLHYPKYADSQPDSGVDDRSSTPDESMDSVGVTSSPSSSSPSTSSASSKSEAEEKIASNLELGGNSWNDVFEQLRREMSLMRERDEQILADLHKVESQLKSVRLATQYGSSSGPPAAAPVPSMPL